ncbi:Crp/Fnr family transcriptional regulator [Rhodopseudomonas sp. B29]|uniref:Crp/Fnr family transcriptional regulator n=1 Tax=Rhodopseudomonas sp. B29 TaxID=95607 RepID=UPI0003454D3E|nr:Crp/Fnr family transcriptional regulator [Rhodopseudomonas sp. B29]
MSRPFDSKDYLCGTGAGRSSLSFRKGDVLFAQGDVADTVYYIRRGRVKVLVLSEQGKEAVVGILEAGQFAGEECLNGHIVHGATLSAMQPSEVTAIRKQAMLETLRSEPDFAELFIRYLLDRNRRISDDLIDQLFNSSERRLARLLLRLAEIGDGAGGVGPQPIAPHISQETLAEMIGTTRSRVSFFMNKFRKLGLISYDREIAVDAGRLSAMLRARPDVHG